MEFEETEVFQDILNNDLCHLQLSLKTADCNLRDHDGRSYLHVAMDQGANEVIFEQLLPYVDISWRDESSSNVLDLAESKDNKNLEKLILKQILEVLRIGTYEQIEKLLTSGWTVWPLPTAICSISGIKPEVSPLLFNIQSIWEKVNDVHVSIMKGRKDTTNCESHLVAASADVTGLPPLQKATIFNHKYYVRYLIDNFPHVLNLQDYMGRTALHYAVVMEDGDISNMLLEAEAVDSIKDVHNNTAMTYQELPHLNTISDVQRHIRFTLHKPQQLKFFDPETLQIIEPMQNYRPMNSGSDQSLINHGDNYRIKHIKTVVTLLRLKQLPSISNRQLEVFEDTILYETVLINDVQEVRFLLEHDHNTQCRSLEGQSYLHLAVTQNVSAEIVHLLLQVIDISLCDSDGFTALDLAVTDDVSTDILFCLLDYIVKLLLSEDFVRLDELVAKGWRHWPPDKYWNCFTQKIRNFLGNMRTIEEQVDKVHSKILRGEKLLQEEIAKDTIGNWDRTGLPALHKAVICGNREAVEDILFQVPEAVNHTDNLSRSALHYAGCLSDQSLFNMLLSNHAVTTIADTWGFTPRDYKLHPNLINIPNLIHHINTIINRQQIVVPDEHWASILQSYNYDKCAGIDPQGPKLKSHIW